MKHAGSALLDRIGPAILLTHSQAGQFGWILADARPSKVKAIIAIEPMGPPFTNAIFPPLTPARPYGLTEYHSHSHHLFNPLQISKLTQYHHQVSISLASNKPCLLENLLNLIMFVYWLLLPRRGIIRCMMHAVWHF